MIDALEGVGTKSLTYLYDFGDRWQHCVRIVRITDAMPGIAYPRLIETAGRCPPEDVGGPWGYRGFLDAIADPGHLDHAEKLQWTGGHCDPTDANAQVLARAVNSPAKKWTRKSAVPKRS